MYRGQIGCRRCALSCRAGFGAPLYVWMYNHVYMSVCFRGSEGLDCNWGFGTTFFRCWLKMVVPGLWFGSQSWLAALKLVNVTMKTCLHNTSAFQCLVELVKFSLQHHTRLSLCEYSIRDSLLRFRVNKLGFLTSRLPREHWRLGWWCRMVIAASWLYPQQLDADMRTL